MEDGARSIRYPHEPPAEGETVELADGVLWMRLPLPMALDHVNVFALDDGDGWTLVDTGMMTRRTQALWVRLVEGPLGGRPVRRVIATHHHPDHIGLAGWFQATQGAEIATSRTAWLTARMLTFDVEELPRPEALALWRAAGMDPGIYAERAAARPFNFADTVAPMAPGFTRLAEDASLDAGGRTWDIRLGQGHAPDHVTLWSRDDHLVIGGDQLLPSISPNVSVHPSEPGADPVGEWLATCARLAAFARADHLVLPGHKLPYRGLPTRLDQLAENHVSALQRLLDRLDQPRRASDCFGAIFKRGMGRAEYLLALGETLAHLNHLVRRGDALREMGEDGAWRFRRAGMPR